MRDGLDPAVVARVAARYPGRWNQGWARGKVAGDPVYRAVLALLPEAGTLVDLGCGEGYLLALARERRPGLDLVGLDHDERRLALARAALEGEARVRLEGGDAREAGLPPADVLACLDVLHYLPPAEQDALVRRMARALRPGGTLLVRDAEAGAGWRSALTAWSERFMVAVGRHRGLGVYLRPRAELEAAMAAAGLAVEVRPCAEGTPFSNVLLVGRAPAARAGDNVEPPAGAS